MKQLIILPIALLASLPAIATPHHSHHPKPAAPATATAASNSNSSSTSDSNSSSTSNSSTTTTNTLNNNNAPTNTYTPRTSTTNSNTTNINYPQVVPNMVGPVPRGYVPVLSVYGQLDYQQRGVYGAQISIPLAR